MKKYFVEKFNASDDSFRIIDIYKLSGDNIKKGDLIFSIESSKANIDIESDESGYIYFNFKKGDNILIGELFYVISIEIINNLTDVFISKPVVIFDGFSISKKALTLLEKYNISPIDINKDIIKEIDVLEYINNRDSTEILDINYIIPCIDKIPIIIIGAGGGAKMCIDLLESSTTFKVVGLLDDNVEIGVRILNIPVIGKIKSVKMIIEMQIYDFVIAFGVLEKRNKRFELYKSLKTLGCRFPNIIHPNSIVEKSTELGEGNVILAGANIGSCVKLGNLNYINNNTLVSHDCVLMDNIHIAPGAVLASSIKIESHVLVGMNTTIYYGLEIGEAATILNGLIINNNIERGLIQKSNN